MAGIQDFRETSEFSRHRVDQCGAYLGHKSYWKLYAIENYLRVILHSVLSVQFREDWFDTYIGKKRRQEIDRLKKDYLNTRVHTLPGRHDIYYLYLSDLNKIMSASRHLFEKVIEDVDSWIVKIEGVRLPRNLVGHMNFPNREDRKRIDKLYGELSTLVQKLERKPKFTVRIP